MSVIVFTFAPVVKFNFLELIIIKAVLPERLFSIYGNVE